MKFLCCSMLVSLSCLTVYADQLADQSQYPAVRTEKQCTIVLDPGHGGVDSGAVSPTGIEEKHITLDIAKKVARRLAQRGVNVLMTRTDDRFMSLKARNHFIRQRKPDFSISIHANSSPDERVEGFESYMYLQKKKTGMLLCSVSSMNPNSFLYPLSVSGQARESKCMQLAYFIHRKIIGLTGARDRGVKSGNFYVLKNRSASLLVETGFLSNAEESEKLIQHEYQEKIAQGLADGSILAMFGKAVRNGYFAAQTGDHETTRQ